MLRPISKTILTSVLITLLYLPLFYNPHTIYADSSETITIYPTLNDVEVVQGESIKLEIFVENNTTATTSYNLYPATIDIAKYLESNELLLETNSEILDWVSLPDTLTVEPFEKQSVEVTITVPEDTLQKTYFPVIVFENASPSRVVNSNQEIEAKVLVYVYLTVLDSMESRPEALEITEFSADKKIVFNRSNIFFLEYANNGEIISKPRGYIELITTPGSVLVDSDLVINEKYVHVLPKLVKQEELTWDKETGIKSLLPILKVNATAKLYSTRGDLVSQREVSFWYIDILKLGIWIVGIIGIIFLLTKLKLSRNGKN